MTVLLRFLLAAAIFSAPAFSAFAQEQGQGYVPIPPERNDILAQPYYEFMAQQALKSRPRDFAFGAFRSKYASTLQYDPLGEETRSRILKLAYDIQNEKDEARRKELRGEYGELLVMHLANIDVVTQALVLAREDRRFGDPEFLNWMRGGLLQSVRNSGDGASLARAYDVMTMGEEKALLRSLPVKVLGSEARESGGTWYSMHLVKDGKHPAPYTVFVDTTRPMAFLAEQKRRKGSEVSIPRQQR